MKKFLPAPLCLFSFVFPAKRLCHQHSGTILQPCFTGQAYPLNAIRYNSFLKIASRYSYTRVYSRSKECQAASG